LGAVFPEKILLVIITENPSKHSTPPPDWSAELPQTVQLVRVMDEFRQLCSPPPHLAEFLLIMQSVTVANESLSPITPPPHIAEFRSIIHSISVANDLP
jgi:hypothetical protein